jgi:hypothetical protein
VQTGHTLRIRRISEKQIGEGRSNTKLKEIEK